MNSWTEQLYLKYHIYLSAQEDDQETVNKARKCKLNWTLKSKFGINREWNCQMGQNTTWSCFSGIPKTQHEVADGIDIICPHDGNHGLLNLHGFPTQKFVEKWGGWRTLFAIKPEPETIFK